MADFSFLSDLEAVIDSRLGMRPESSYTATLVSKGLSKTAQKVGEEGLEVALAAVAESNESLLNESADLLFHLLVLLRVKGLQLEDVCAVLRARHQAASR